KSAQIREILISESAWEEMTCLFAPSLEWRREGNELVVNNPTPFYMNFQAVTLNGQKVTKATWAVPKTETHFAIPGNVRGSNVTYSIITDYGSISHTWSKSVH
ncbi:hypothetical protein QCN12_11220, partial [Enterobacter roggenkampii]